MDWKFWARKKSDTILKLSKPKELPSVVGRHLVVALQYDPDWVWKLKMVQIEKENKKGAFYFRVFDPVSAMIKGITVLNYHTLETHPELIFFDGWYDKNTWEITTNDRYKLLKRDNAA